MIKKWLEKYNIKTQEDALNARREIVQEVALSGLKRSGFLDHAAFYGGTALRIFYGLDRYSEDLDFSLLKKDLNFTLEPYLKIVEDEFQYVGLSVEINIKDKKHVSTIESAFLKEDTLWATLNIETPGLFKNIKNLKVKIEVDRDPPLNFKTESKLMMLPFTQYINCMRISDLFAGKMHALLFRKWVNNVKGRDWYDLVWYVKHGVELNLDHFNSRAEASNDLLNKQFYDKSTLINLLHKKIDTLNVDFALRDISRFVENQASLEIWSKQFFHDIADRIKILS